MYNIAHRHKSVELGTKAVQCPEKEHINGIFVVVHFAKDLNYCFEKTPFLQEPELKIKTVSVDSGIELNS